MGKAMDKSSVIYGGKTTVGLTSVNWTEIERLILEQVGDEPLATPLAGARKAVDAAKKDKSLEKAYVKVGLVGKDLVLRIKDVRTLIDKEIDSILVKQFEQKRDAHQKMVLAQAKGGGGDGGKVVSLDPKDKTIRESAEEVAKKRKLGADAPLQRAGDAYGDKDKKHGKVVDDPKLKNSDFGGASSAPIVILAHGTPLGKVGSGKVHATNFGDKKPADIVSYLKKSLPVTYSGVIYLDGCYTAAGNTPLNFGMQVYQGLVKAGYFYLQVKGNLGMARTIDGKEVVTPAEIETAYDNARLEKEKLEKEKKVLDKPYDDANKLLVDRENELKIKIRVGDKSAETAKALQEATKKVDALKLKRQNDPKLKKIVDRIAVLQAIMDQPKFNIEALTGTWGPEKLPPKRA